MVDEDASFLASELGLPGPPEAVCPVVITQDLVMAAYRGEPLRLKDRILDAVEMAASRADALLLGGAANLRDGIFLGISPLALISELDCRVLLVDRFSGEKSMDQILWAAGELRERLLGSSGRGRGAPRVEAKPHLEPGGRRQAERNRRRPCL